MRGLNPGTKVRVNSRHRGCAGKAGTVTGGPRRCRGHEYITVRLSDGWTMRFTARELDRRTR